MLLPIMRTRRRRSVGAVNKVHGAEADRLQLVLKKMCSQAHQSFMFASDEAFQIVSHRGEPRTVSPRRDVHVLSSTPL